VISLINEIHKLRVGSRGEIYTTKKIREIIGLEPSSEVLAIVTEDGLLIKPKKSLKSLLKKRQITLKMSVEEFERVSEEIQEEMLKSD